MAAYQIFVPGVTGADTEANLAKAGLLHLRAEGMDWYDVSSSPFGDKSHGAVGTWVKGDTTHDPLMGFHECQTWIPAKAHEKRELPAERFWIGVEFDRRPLPGNIMRKNIIPGDRVLACDNELWTIPTVKKLPHTHGLDDKGEFSRIVSKEYQRYAELAAGYMATVFSEIDIDLETLLSGKEVVPRNVNIDIEAGWEFVCQALNINYYLCAEVIDALDLVNDRVTVGIVSAAIDLPMILDTVDQKKSPAPDRVGIPIGQNT